MAWAFSACALLLAPFGISDSRSGSGFLPLPLYPGGEGRGEGVLYPTPKPCISARADPLTPDPSPPEYRWRGEKCEGVQIRTVAVLRADPEECPCAEEKVNVTVIVILASEKGNDIDKRLTAVAKEVRAKCPNLTNFELKSITTKPLVVDQKTMFAAVDKKEVAVTIKRATDDENKVSLVVIAPEQGEIGLRCVCGKFLPIITRYQRKTNERLILAISVESCKGE